MYFGLGVYGEETKYIFTASNPNGVMDWCFNNLVMAGYNSRSYWFANSWKLLILKP